MKHASPGSLRLGVLGQRLYELSLVRREQEFITDPAGVPIGWLLDTRIPMLIGSVAREVGAVLADRLRARDLVQVAGYGFGSYAIVCATINAPGSPALQGGIIRSERKGHGRRRVIEGPLDKGKPLVLMDDILNSGTSAMHALRLLRGEGYLVVGLVTLFEFTWSLGRARIEAEGLWVDPLLDLHLRDGSCGRSDSA